LIPAAIEPQFLADDGPQCVNAHRDPDLGLHGVAGVGLRHPLFVRCPLVLALPLEAAQFLLRRAFDAVLLLRQSSQIAVPILARVAADDGYHGHVGLLRLVMIFSQRLFQRSVGSRQIPKRDFSRQQRHGRNHPDNPISIANEIGMESDAHCVRLVIDRGNQKAPVVNPNRENETLFSIFYATQVSYISIVAVDHRKI